MKISDMPALVSLADSDLFEIEQDGISKKCSWDQARSLLPFRTNSLVPIQGDMVGVVDLARLSGPVPRWRTIPAVAYTATPTSTTIFFSGAAPSGGVYYRATDYFIVGDAVRTTISGTNYYSIVTAVTTSSLTLAGKSLPTAAITQLAIGVRSMFKTVSLQHHATGYNASTTIPVGKGCKHHWMGATGYLVRYSIAHMNTASTTTVQVLLNGSAATTPTAPAAGTGTTYGNFSSTGALNGQVSLSHGQDITIMTPVIAGSADFLIVKLEFLVP